MSRKTNIKLRADNRWAKLAKTIPWESIEERYANLFTSNHGRYGT